MKVGAAILAAGSGTRFGKDKTLALLGGRPVWQWSYDTFANSPQIDCVVVAAGENLEAVRAAGVERVIPGGASRTESSILAVTHLLDQGCDVILVHDAARPFVTEALIARVIEGVQSSGAAAVVVPVTDTIRQWESSKPVTVDRSSLAAMQTPQGGTDDVFRKALAHAAAASSTDEIGLIEASGSAWQPVDGSKFNFKVTTPEDMILARGMLDHQTRTGLGFDIHRFSQDQARPMHLGGIHFPGVIGLEGHSDADVIIHAIVDAILGAAGLGDIGVHFPPSDPQWKDASSSVFLTHAAKLVRAQGWTIDHVDAAVQAEAPKIMPRASEMRSALAKALETTPDQVSVKATTNEGLGAIGRKEGISAFAVASLSRWLAPDLS